MSSNWSKEDLIDIHRRSLRELELSKYLGTKPDKIFRTERDYKSNFYKYSICSVLSEFLTKHGYKISQSVGLCDSGHYPLKKEDIEVRYKKYKKCVTEGCLFIQDAAGNKFVLELEESYRSDSWNLSLFYKEAQENLVLTFVQDLEKYAVENSFLKNSKIDPALAHIEVNKEYNWNDIVLPSSIKSELKTNIDNLFSNIEVYKNNNLSFKRGIILKGEPGTGKTLIGKILSAQAKCSFIWVTPKFLQDANKIRSIVILAREIAPTILFLEDIDLYGSNRDSNSNASLLGELMNQLDGLVENQYIVTVATTNNAEKLENALRNRPGRFDRVIEIPKPTCKGRVRMLKLHTGNCNINNVNFTSIAEKIDGYTGAHVKELVTTAIISAIDENSITDGTIVLKQNHFEDNIEKVKAKKVSPIGFTSDTHDPLDDYEL